MSPSPIEVMGRPENTGETAGEFIAKLEQLKASLRQLREHEFTEPPEVKAQRILATHKKLGNLARQIEIAKQGAIEWTEVEAVDVKNKAKEILEEDIAILKRDLKDDSLFLIEDLLVKLQTGAGALAKQKHNDPGPTLGAIERTADLVGGRVAPMVAGGALGTSAATALGLSAGLSTTAMIAGTVGGAVAAPIAVEAVTSKIENPKARAVVKTALYGLMAGGAVLLAPQAIPALAISFGIAGAINLINWFRQKGAAAERASQAQPRAAPQAA